MTLSAWKHSSSNGLVISNHSFNKLKQLYKIRRQTFYLLVHLPTFGVSFLWELYEYSVLPRVDSGWARGEIFWEFWGCYIARNDPPCVSIMNLFRIFNPGSNLWNNILFGIDMWPCVRWNRIAWEIDAHEVEIVKLRDSWEEFCGCVNTEQNAWESRKMRESW